MQPPAIQHVDFMLARGERMAIIGPNGAGKSTLFKTLIGLIPHSTGEISLNGKDCRTSHTMIGYVSQNQAIDRNFPVSVRDVVMLGRLRKMGWLRWPRRRDWDAVDKALEQVSLLAFRDRQIGQLSGGQMRRVFIARALAQETDVLLLDEPFSGVDATVEREITEALDRLRKDNITVLLATHDFQFATEKADRLLILNQRVIACGLPADVFVPDKLKAAYGKHGSVFIRDHPILFVADEHHQG